MIFAPIIDVKRLLPSVLLVFCISATAQTGADEFLPVVADDLRAQNIEVLPDLNDRDDVSRRLVAPRLGGFADLPPGSYPDSAEIETWEAALRAGEIGGVTLHSDSPIYPLPEGAVVYDDRIFKDRLREWTSQHERERLFITFAVDDDDVAMRILEAARQNGYDTDSFNRDELPVPEQLISAAAEFYATAHHRLAIDSREARRLRTGVTELELLGERLRRDSTSVFRDPVDRDERSLSRYEPEVFRKLTLGDEFNQSTIEEIVVPGGIALGEGAELDFVPAELVFDGNFFMLHGRDLETGRQEVRRLLPRDDLQVLKTLFDFTRRSTAIRSDAVVDLDADRRVRISSALRDTDAGYATLLADTLPFEYLDYLPVTKSVVIDTEVSWVWSGIEDSLLQQFETGFEVRFLSADSMRIAQTRLALEYEYDSTTGEVTYNGNWGRYGSRLLGSTDVDSLGEGLAELARYAGWVALFRRLEEDSVPFLQGRYQFMKIDKAGRETPRRFR